jgi:predicted amidophosphoribosyltransferase
VIKDEIKKKNIIVIDDVFTTGATAFELVTELERAKAGKIFIVTVAQA